MHEAVLELVGELAGEVIAPAAGEVDAEGAHLRDGKVVWAKATTSHWFSESAASRSGGNRPLPPTAPARR